MVLLFPAIPGLRSCPVVRSFVSGAHVDLRLYLDESGDHTYPVDPDPEPGKRYLALVGVWFPREGPTYAFFGADLEELKRRHFPYDADDPPVLHRKELMNASGPFWHLQDDAKRRAFNRELLRLIERHPFTIIGVVIDKVEHRRRYQIAAFHPYHYCLDAMLERYCGFLKHLGHKGDVMAESRGGTFDRELKEAYRQSYVQGTFLGYTTAEVIQRTLTSKEVKLKAKASNIAGLQLADVLASAVKYDVLAEYKRLPHPEGFDAEICQVLEANRKYNRHLYNNRVRGYGMVVL